MPIVVRSPYSGKPVKVRDQDVGRAIRDEEGRIFYVVQRSEGAGYYAAPTRQGSEKDEQRYDELEERAAREEPLAASAQAQPMHDATGKRRPNRALRLVVLLLILIALAVAAAYFFRDELGAFLPAPAPQPVPQPTEEQAVEQEVSLRIEMDGMIVSLHSAGLARGPQRRGCHPLYGGGAAWACGAQGLRHAA